MEPVSYNPIGAVNKSEIANDFLSRNISTAIVDTTKAVDAYILNFFGGEENVQKYGANYVLEEGELEWSDILDDSGATLTYKLSQTVRLRLKTPEEKAAE